MKKFRMHNFKNKKTFFSIFLLLICVFCIILVIAFKSGTASDLNAANAANEAKSTKGIDNNGEDSLKKSDSTAEAELALEKETEGEGRVYYASFAGRQITKLSVNGNHITDASGNIALLRGVSTHGLSWFPEYVNGELFRQLSIDWNVNCVRLAMYTAEYNGYCTGDQANKERLKAVVDDGVRYAVDNGMYVIIDWHVLNDRNPNVYVDEAKEFFSYAADRYGSLDNVIFEICNEPNGGVGWDEIKSYAYEVIPCIREHSDAVIIVGTPNWSQRVDEAAADPITGYDNICYALHYYAATHKESLRNTLVDAYNDGLPVFVSEFGICDASGSGSIDEYQADEWAALLDDLGISSVAWSLCNKNETASIIDSGCSKTYDLDYEDLSASGKWLYNNIQKGKEYTKTGLHPDSVGVISSAYSSEETNDTTTALPGQGNNNQNNHNDNNAGNNNSGNNNSGNNESPNKNVLVNPRYELVLSNSWESGEAKFYQYSLIVYNDTGKESSSWNLSLDFDKEVSLQSGWCANLKAEGNTISVSSLEYNGRISPSGSYEGVGMIISIGK